MDRQVKSKERVAEHGEVFTAGREVKAMCDLVAGMCTDLYATFLEPACGEGAFLTEVLRRKLAAAAGMPDKDKDTYEWRTVAAVSGLYGIDIMQDNAEICRKNLFDIWRAACPAADTETQDAVKFILSRNILCGNALSLMCVDGEQADTPTPLLFSEWIDKTDDGKPKSEAGYFCRRDFYLNKLLLEQEETMQTSLGFFDQTEERHGLATDWQEWNEGDEKALPVAEFPICEYNRVQYSEKIN